MRITTGIDEERISTKPDGKASQNGENLLRVVATAYAALVCFVLPLLLHNGYYDVTETKHSFYLTASLALFVGMVAALFLRPPTYRPPIQRLRDFGQSMLAADWFLLAFFLIYLVASLLSAHPREALSGLYNRYQGLTTIAVYALVFLCVSRCRVRLSFPIAALCVSASLCAALALFNVCGLDPLRLLATLTAYDRGRFLSFTGNVNFYAAFLSLAFPVALFSACGAKRRLPLLLYGACTICVWLGMLVSCSESGALAAGVCLLAALPLTMRDAKSARRLPFALCALFTLAGLFPFLVQADVSPYALSFFFRLLMRPYLAFPLALICLIAGLILRHADAPGIARAYRRLFLACIGLLTLLTLCVVLVNTVYTDLPLGAVGRFLRFTAGWGTDRGKVWRYCVDVFETFSPLQKLFGGGAGVLYYADRVSAVFLDAALDSAHNEYLQYLLTSGVLGLAAYVGFLVCTLTVSFAASRMDALLRGFWLGAFSCAIQAFVNIAQPASTPLLFLFCALLVGASRPASKPDASPTGA